MRKSLPASALALASASGLASALPAEMNALHEAIHNGKRAGPGNPDSGLSGQAA